LVAKVTDKIGSEGKDVKSTFSTSSAGSPTDVLGGYIAELPFYRYQYVTLVGLTTEYRGVPIQKNALRPMQFWRYISESDGFCPEWTSPRRFTVTEALIQ